jgi:hypothetical protein
MDALYYVWAELGGARGHYTVRDTTSREVGPPQSVRLLRAIPRIDIIFRKFLAQNVCRARPVAQKFYLFFVHSHYSVCFTAQSNFLYIPQVKSNFQKIMLSFLNFLRISIIFRILNRKFAVICILRSCDAHFQNIFRYRCVIS